MELTSKGTSLLYKGVDILQYFIKLTTFNNYQIYFAESNKEFFITLLIRSIIALLINFTKGTNVFKILIDPELSLLWWSNKIFGIFKEDPTGQLIYCPNKSENNRAINSHQ